MIVSRSLAALATVPGREAALARCLASLRPQVERIAVVCHDLEHPPDCVREFADEWICEPDTRGANAKFHWASSWIGLYLACDDDWEYPPDYAATMLRWVKRWKGRALVTTHGRVFEGSPTHFRKASAGWGPRQRNDGGWINYPGAGALAFDTRLAVPQLPGKNVDEAELAIWAQRRRVPIWMVPHSAAWLAWLLENMQVPTIWAEEKANGFAKRNAVIATHAPWQVHRL